MGVLSKEQWRKMLAILATTEDMVRSGFVHSLAKAGGNTTGVGILPPNLMFSGRKS
jgi:hypothetical protein